MTRSLIVVNMLVCAVAVILIGFAPESSYYQLYVADLALYSLLAVSFDVTFGFAGMLSLAQALFFGASAYTIGWLLLSAHVDLALAIPAALLVTAVIAAATGYVAVRGGNHGLLILTLIFVTVAYTWAQNHRELTGGDDGLILAGEPFRFFGVDLTSLGRYRLSLGCFAVAFAISAYLMWSPFGRVLRAIKENELRAEFVGYDTKWIKIAAFTLSGLIAAAAGTIYTITFQHVHTGLLHWTVSASALVWAFFGGLGTLAGPVLGTVLIRPFEDLTGAWIGHPKFFTGLILLAMVLVARSGVLGLLLQIPIWRRRKPKTIEQRQF